MKAHLKLVCILVKANGGCVLQLLHVVEDFFLMGKSLYIDFFSTHIAKEGIVSG